MRMIVFGLGLRLRAPMLCVTLPSPAHPSQYYVGCYFANPNISRYVNAIFSICHWVPAWRRKKHPMCNILGDAFSITNCKRHHLEYIAHKRMTILGYPLVAQSGTERNGTGVKRFPFPDHPSLVLLCVTLSIPLSDVQYIG